MKLALEAMRRGELVSDELAISMVRERARCLSCCGGFLLDGFPRTVPQAQALDGLLTEQGVSLDAVFAYELPLDEIIDRLSGRRTCDGCKAVYHVTAQSPRVENVCDRCGGRLFQREDDRPDSIRIRMRSYDDSTRPLLEYYEKRGILLKIPARGTPSEIRDRSLRALSQRRVMV
jgi:adenylate kinase